jgi:ADP-L-glycero-D-manno-heptose 6-epimerase
MLYKVHSARQPVLSAQGEEMIIISGGSGFIGSALLWRLNQLSIREVMIVDNWHTSPKWLNIRTLHYTEAMHKDDFLPWLTAGADGSTIEAIFHLGACSSTEEKDLDYLWRNNVHYSMALFRYCTKNAIPFIYASSAATYGAAEEGFADDHAQAATLQPINPYGLSKKLFDTWVLNQKECPPLWVGLKFFNVFGPNEYHKGSMRSLVCKAVPQIEKSGKVGLFRSHRAGIADGEQKRDFIYVKDVVEVMVHFWQESKNQAIGARRSGIYNVGSGQARTFYDLAQAVFAALEKPCEISWIDMPESIREGYQYFTEARMEKLREQGGYTKPFTSLEAGVQEYVRSYLKGGESFLQ